MESKNKKILGLIKTLSQLDKKELNNVQEDLLKFVSQAKASETELNTYLKNIKLYKGIEKYSDLHTVILDPKDWETLQIGLDPKDWPTK